MRLMSILAPPEIWNIYIDSAINSVSLLEKRTFLVDFVNKYV